MADPQAMPQPQQQSTNDSFGAPEPMQQSPSPFGAPEPMQPAQIKPDGGVLGQAALGALQGATDHQQQTAEESALGKTGTFLEGVNKSLPFREEINTGTQDAINLIRLGYEKLRGQGHNIGISDVIHSGKATENAQENIENQENPSLLRGSGEVIGNVAQFIAGDEALKSLDISEKLGIAGQVMKLAKTSPKLAKALDIGMTALRQGVVGGAQTLATGGTGKEAVGTGAGVGIASGAFGAAGEGAGALYRMLSARTPEAIEAAQAQAAKEGTELAEKIADAPLKSGVEAAQDVKYQLGKAEDAMHADFAQGMHNISQQLPDLVINTANSPLQQTARDILGDTSLPPEMQKALKGVVPDMARLEPLLKTLAEGDERQGFTYSWEQMLNMRSGIGQTIRRLPYDSPIRGDLINLRGAMDNTIQQSVDKAGVPDVAKDLQNLRNAYATKIKAFDASAIKTLAEKNPDSIVPILMRGEKIFNADTLRSLIGEQNMKPVQGQLLREMIDNAYSTVTKSGGTEQQFNPRVFVKNFENLSPEVQKAFWGDNLPEVQNFLKTVESVPNLDSKLAAAQHYLTHRALFDAPLAASALLVGSPESWRGGEIRGLGLIVGGLLLFNRPQLLNLVSKFLTKGVPDIVGGTAQEINKPEENKTENPPNENNESENMLTKPENHVHIRNSEGNEFFIPQNQMDKARQIDPGLQLLKESGQENA